jgi:hypothetical protein
MKSTISLILASVLLAVAAAPAARAQVASVEHINTIATSFDPWEAFFPNVYDPLHPKELRFEGIATGGGDPTTFPATLYVQFDWLDPMLGVIYSPPWPVPISYTPALTPIDVSWTIDFCPQQVSLHLATDAPFGGVVNIAGEFTHRCVPNGVPEGGSFALIGALGMIGLIACRRRFESPS